MTLPYNSSLPINALASCFKHRSSAYKFYWFLAILQEVEKGNISPSKKELFAGMIANAWYTVNYFHVSFGKQDELQNAIETIREIEGLYIDDNRDKIRDTLIRSTNKETLKYLRHFDKEVPWRFLNPWLKAANKDAASLASSDFNNGCPYALKVETIEVNPAWVTYMTQNAAVLKAFCFWNLSLYLQKHNPNVPDIPNKLIKPTFRNNLNKQRLFWDIVLDELGAVECIYTQTMLTKGNFAVEHFIPHAFVSHDLMWNLIPACKAFNNSKSDRLPPLDIYFDKFYDLQIKGLKIVRLKEPKNILLEDYLSIYPDGGTIGDSVSKERFREQLQPLLTIAANSGFEFMRRPG